MLRVVGNKHVFFNKTFKKETLLTTELDWSKYYYTGEQAQEHILKNHTGVNLTKFKQGVFYGNAIKATKAAWSIARQLGVKPITHQGKDFYIIPRANSGYEAGICGQLQVHNHITIVTFANTNKLITAYPSGANPIPLPKNYQFSFAESLSSRRSWRR